MPPTTQIRIRRDTAANFTSANPTLALGEIAYETDTFRFKVGTGSTTWTSLGYAAQNPTSLTVASDAFINGVRVGAGPAGNRNTVLGNTAGAALQAGAADNVLIGFGAGDSLTSGDDSVAIGRDALSDAQTSSDNTAIGRDAALRMTGGGNTAIGARACAGVSGSSSGSFNVAIGDRALLSATSTNFAVAVGTLAQRFNTANDNVAVGGEALDANTLGTANVAVGRSALGAATTSIGTFTTTPVAAGSGYTANQTGVTVTLVKKSGADTFTGTVQAALTTNASGAVTAVAATPVSAGSVFTGSNVIFEPSGFGAGSGCEISIATLATAGSNTALGHQAGLSITTGTFNTLVGANAGDNLTTGLYNIAVGWNAIGGSSTGSRNVAIGNSLYSASLTGSRNIAVGHENLSSLQGGSYNIAIGTGGTGEGNGNLASLTSGSYNTAVGPSNGNTLGTGSGNLLLGAVDVAAAGDANSVVIAGRQSSGVYQVGNGSNTTTIGNSSTTGTFIPAGNLTLSNHTFGDQNGLIIKSTTADLRVQAADGTFGDAAIGTYHNGPLGIKTNSTRRIFIGTDGNVTIVNGNLILGTAGKGIDFSADANAAGMTSELLDDYEEGTWTPGIEFGGASVALTFSVRPATYTKIGRQVTVAARVNLSNKGTSVGDAIITGLPFTSLSTGNVAYAPSFRYENITAVNHLTGFLGSNGTTINLNETNDAGVISTITDADFANNSGFLLTATYFTA